MQEKILVCSVCGYKKVDDGKKDPCLKCSADHSKFEALSEEDAAKIFASDRTNDIYCEIIKLSMEIEALCKEGLDIKLDPKCVSVFGYLKDASWNTKQLCKAELGGHMKLGKW